MAPPNPHYYDILQPDMIIVPAAQAAGLTHPLFELEITETYDILP